MVIFYCLATLQRTLWRLKDQRLWKATHPVNLKKSVIDTSGNSRKRLFTIEKPSNSRQWTVAENAALTQYTEEVGQAGRKASWVPVPNCARDFIDSMAVVE